MLHNMSIEKRPGLYIPPDLDPNTTYRTGSVVQRVTDTGKFLYVEDPQLGIYTLGDGNTPYHRFVYDVMTTPGMIRSMGVSQLCKDEASATIPNTAQFTRYSGMVALVHVVERFADKQKLNDEQKIGLILDVVLDDSAHWLYSHALELDKQGWGGPEDNHESVWPSYARHGGIVDIIRKYGIKTDARLRLEGMSSQKWAKASAPDIDPDRWQYNPGEAGLWLDTDDVSEETRSAIRSMYSLETLEIDSEGYLAFKDPEIALLYAKMYLLESTEDWNDPINRMQLFLTVQSVKRLIVQRRFPWMNEVDRGLTRKPDWYLYGVDADVVKALMESDGHTDPTLYAIHGVQNPIATAERIRFKKYKRSEYADFLLDRKARDYPSEHLSPKRVEFGISHPSISITMEQSSGDGLLAHQTMPILTHNNGSIHYTLMPLKNRFVDPRVLQQDGSSKRLSEIYPQYKKLLEQHQRLQSMKTNVELVLTKKFRDEFVSVLTKNDEDFKALQQAQDFTSDQKRRIIELAAERAKMLAVQTGRYVIS